MEGLWLADHEISEQDIRSTGIVRSGDQAHIPTCEGGIGCRGDLGSIGIECQGATHAIRADMVARQALIDPIHGLNISIRR